MNRKTLLLTTSLAVLALAACSTAAAPEPVSISIELSEYAFSPSQIELQVGQEVTLDIVNVGQLDHEIMFGRDVMMVENRPSGYMMDMFENGNVEPMVIMDTGMEMEEEHAEGEDGHEEDEMGHEGFMVFLPPGDDTASISFTVTDDMVGEWEIGCFELNGVHYDAGMVGTLVVKP
ncbi:MAG: cupredoxin domain-containing protein [Anaerolineae bacterium]|nr:cupredoxin domain-containing protein [Anaerolineae bacterium]